MYEITYVFKSGRKEKYINSNIEAKELYYGLPLFEDKNNIGVLEFNEELGSNRFFFSEKVEGVLSNLLSLPFYFQKYLLKKILKF